MSSSALAETIRLQGEGFRALGCPFYGALGLELARDVEQDGPVARMLAPYAEATFEAAYVLRLFGGVHRMVLAGDAPEVARHYPSVGGDGDAQAAIAAMRDLLTVPPATVLDAMTRPPQTNEVGRSVALVSGMLVLARDVGLPLRLREMGSSAGLNSRCDSYWYEQDGTGWGRSDSPVRFVDLWSGGAPPFSAGMEILDRRACDRDPIDASTEGGAWTLLSYVWPEPAERFTRARDAIALAAEVPVVIDRADVIDWLPEQLREPHPGSALVVFHSVFWQYLPPETQVALRANLDEAGATATRDAPLAWLRLEPHATNYIPAELRLTTWDGTSPRAARATPRHDGLPRRPDQLARLMLQESSESLRMVPSRSDSDCVRHDAFRGTHA